MNIQAYLNRIGYLGPLEATPEVLRGLQLAHLYSVPFENLSVARHEPVWLSIPALFDKIVWRRRGGCCYELNGLFGSLLQEIGFQVDFLSARGFDDEGGLSPEFDHLTLLVRAPGLTQPPWLVDAGFGDSFLEPLRMDLEGEQPQGLRAYRLAQLEGAWILWQRNYDGSWEQQFRFTLQPRAFPADFEEMNHYHQTSPASPFTRQRMCTRALPEGRITLWDTRLVVTRLGERSETALVEADRPAILRECFGIGLD